MDWRIAPKEGVTCTSSTCPGGGKGHQVPAGEIFVRVSRGGSDRCLGWVTRERELVAGQIRDREAELATAGDRREELENRIADLTKQIAVFDIPSDLRTSVPVPQPTLPMELHRGTDTVSMKQLGKSTNYSRALEAIRRQVGRNK